MAKIYNFIVFGDSMSDIGIKRETYLIRAVRFGQAVLPIASLIRINEIGRFSDRKNWTDFLWEWSGGETMIWKDKDTANKLSNNHKSLAHTTGKSGTGSRVGSPQVNSTGDKLVYLNYAQGGAMGASDRSATGLGTFKDQVDEYLSQIKGRSNETLYIIWFGLNDLITNKRDKTDMLPVVQEQLRLCKRIQEQTGGVFLIMNLPSPEEAARYLGQQLSNEVRGYQKGAENYNNLLESEIKSNRYQFAPDSIKMVDLYAGFLEVSRNLKLYGLRKGAQPRGIKVRYYSSSQPYESGPLPPMSTKDINGNPFPVNGSIMAYELENSYLAPYERANQGKRISRIFQIDIIRKEIRAGSPDDVIYAAAKLARDQASDDTGTFGRSSLRDTLDNFLKQDKYADFADVNSSWTTTSDGAHPTEAAYKIIAKIVVKTIRDNNWDIGKLNDCREADFIAAEPDMGKCPGCRKHGHQGDAIYCRFCGTKL
jgi:lysophospholipase L1-like esterase